MRRIFFKERMKDAVLQGIKSSTTRDHEKKTGLWEACTGSYYHAEPFAIIEITSVETMQWEKVLQEHFKEEGFASPEDAFGWCTSAGLHYSGEIFFHRFKVIKCDFDSNPAVRSFDAGEVNVCETCLPYFLKPTEVTERKA